MKGSLALLGFYLMGHLIWLGVSRENGFLDNAGYVSHTYETPTVFADGWMRGETKNCFAVLEHGERPTMSEGPVSQMNCDFEFDPKYVHVLRVIYWGRLTRPEKADVPEIRIRWRCVQGWLALSCYALD